METSSPNAQPPELADSLVADPEGSTPPLPKPVIVLSPEPVPSISHPQNVCDVAENGEISKYHFAGVEETTLDICTIIYVMFHCVTKWKVLCLVT
jgi:hypothetical protein